MQVKCSVNTEMRSRGKTAATLNNVEKIAGFNKLLLINY